MIAALRFQRKIDPDKFGKPGRKGAGGNNQAGGGIGLIRWVTDTGASWGAEIPLTSARTI